MGRALFDLCVIAGCTGLALAASFSRYEAAGRAGPSVPNGARLSSEPCVVSSASYDEYVAVLASRPPADRRDTPFDATTFRRNTPEVWFRALKSESGVRCRKVRYASDGLGVAAYVVEPVTAGRHPAVVINRGGTGAFGMIRTGELVEMAGWALDGYVAVASQYRGTDGGDGQDEYGGADVADVLNVAALARGLPTVDPEALYAYGLSRGGMMTYLALRQGLVVRAAATVGAPTNLAGGLAERPEMDEVYRELMPGYATRKDEHLRARSALEWPEQLTAPLLILHGGADWRVPPADALALASRLEALDRPYGLMVYAGDDHPLTRSWPEARAKIRAWFRAHAKNE